MLDDAWRQLQSSDLLVDDLLGVGREDEMNLMVSLAQMVEKPLQINGSTGSSGGKDEAHA
jgi:hypothetical protein